MTERKWTSGPWVVQDETLYGTDFGYTVPLMDLSFYAENERYEDDANLISAAPDLYEALEDAVDALKYGSDYSESNWVVLTANAALAKARGEQ